MLVYVGAYTEQEYDGKAEGISSFDFDLETGVADSIGVAAGVANPSFLTLDESGRFLYAVNELSEGGATAFSRDPESGALTALNREDSHGADPCYVSLGGEGRFALVARTTPAGRWPCCRSPLTAGSDPRRTWCATRVRVRGRSRTEHTPT